jgi:ribosomal protein S18 acetylase RimI-like enzyme
MAALKGVSRSNIRRRPAQPEDEALLCQLYGATREDVALMGLDETQKTALIESQFQIQHTQYTRPATAVCDIVLLDDEPIGRLYLEEREHEIRIVDVAVLPDYRNCGIGTMLLKGVLAGATQTGLMVTLHVRRDNPAVRLYQRLGFTRKREDEVHHFMEWVPGQEES